MKQMPGAVSASSFGIMRAMLLGNLKPSRKGNGLSRRMLFAIFLLLLCWRWGLSEDEGAFVQFLPGAYAHETFGINDPDEVRKPGAVATRPVRKFETFAHWVLDLDAGEAVVGAEKYALLDSIIEDAKRRIVYDSKLDDPKAMQKQAEKVLRMIDQVLTDHNVLYPPADFDVNSLRAGLSGQHYDKKALERVLRVGYNKRRREHARAHAGEAFYILDCDTSSFIYMGIADAMGIDLHLVDLPDHMFVRWELEDGTHLNWDTNSADVVPDKEFVTDYGLGKKIRKNRVYLASMTRRESEGYIYFLRATRFEDREENQKAIADLEKARELYPQSTQAASELAWLYAIADGVDAEHRWMAIELAQSAVDFEPKCGDFWDSLAAAHAANGLFKLAVKEARQAEYLAETAEDRGVFKMHRKVFEKGEMPDQPRSVEH